MIFPDAMIYLNVFRQIKQFPNHIKTKQNLDCNFTLSNDLAPNGIPFVAKSKAEKDFDMKRRLLWTKKNSPVC